MSVKWGLVIVKEPVSLASLCKTENYFPRSLLSAIVLSVKGLEQSITKQTLALFLIWDEQRRSLAACLREVHHGKASRRV
jgi:hypothetical protein